MSTKRQIALGAFFVIVAVILGYYTLFLSDWRPFSREHGRLVYFPDANGLRQGDSVLVAGIRAGRVRALAYDPAAPMDRRISASLVLDSEVPLRRGFSIRIEDATLLGGKHVAVDPGPPEAPTVPHDEVLFGTIAGNALGRLSGFIEENSASVGRILANVESVTDNLAGGRGVLGRLASDEALAESVAAAVDRIREAFDQLAELTAGVREGRGLMGRVFTDEELAARASDAVERLANVMRDLEAFSADLSRGEGALGALVRDAEMGADLRQAVENVRDVTARIRAGEGMLGALVADATLREDFAGVFRRLGSGEGTLGRLFTSDELYNSVARTVDNLDAASAALRNADGTLGKLLMQDDLYLQLDRALRMVTRALEEYREAAPITTFTSVLFGAL